MKNRNVADTLKELLNNAKTEQTKQKLLSINKVCETIKSNHGIISIKSVVSMLNSNGVKISQRSIYNKRGGDNVYRKLIDAWVADSESSLQAKKSPIAPLVEADLLSEAELLEIGDQVLRYRVLMLLQELKSLRSQIGMIRNIRELPEVSLQAMNNTDISNDPVLDSKAKESKLQEDSISSIFKRPYSNLITFDDEGTLTANRPLRKGEKLSYPGLEDALKRVVES